MKAIVVHQYGGPEVLKFEEYPDPTPGASEVLVRVAASSVNPIDYKRRAGLTTDFYLMHFPGLIGVDMAGTIVKNWVRSRRLFRWRPGVRHGGRSAYGAAPARLAGQSLHDFEGWNLGTFVRSLPGRFISTCASRGSPHILRRYEGVYCCYRLLKVNCAFFSAHLSNACNHRLS